MRLLSATSLALLMLTVNSASAVSPPCSCLQEIWVDYPGPYDLYIALSKEYDCSEVGEEGLWYGSPSNLTLPQICDNDECEDYQGDDRRSAQFFPGHGQELAGVKAWETFRVGLEAAVRKMPGLEYGMPAFHKIPQKNVPANVSAAGDMLVMAIPMTVHAKGSRIDGKTYYLCIQIDSAEGVPLTPATFDDGRSSIGSQMQTKYRVNGNVRKGLVWLK
jgi:hypothetical protein